MKFVVVETLLYLFPSKATFISQLPDFDVIAFDTCSIRYFGKVNVKLTLCEIDFMIVIHEQLCILFIYQ